MCMVCVCVCIGVRVWFVCRCAWVCMGVGWARWVWMECIGVCWCAQVCVGVCGCVGGCGCAWVRVGDYKHLIQLTHEDNTLHS